MYALTPLPFYFTCVIVCGDVCARARVSRLTISRRPLFQIAKVLQNLANRCPFGEKEPFMVPMNVFLKVP